MKAQKKLDTELDVAELTDGILSQTQSIIGSYLSDAFGYVENINWMKRMKRMKKYSDREHVSNLNWSLTPKTNFWSTTNNKPWLVQLILTKDKHVLIPSRSFIQFGLF